MLGDLIKAGTSIFGGIMGSNSTASANRWAAHEARLNREMQYEFAQNGIQWRAEDARKAGIHPIYALGSAGASFSPVSTNFQTDTALPNAMAAAGQDIGRAVNATRTQEQRVDAFTQTAQKLSLEKASLENDLLRTEIASAAGRLRTAQAPPFPAPGNAYNIPGQTQSGLVKGEPLEVTVGHPKQPQSEGGAITDVGYARTGTGWAPVPSDNVKNRIEDNFFHEALHFMRNNVMPSVGYNFNPPPFKAPEGKEWHFHVPSQEYRLQPKGQGWWKRGFTVRDERK